MWAFTRWPAARAEHRASEDTCSDDLCKLLGVGAGGSGVGAAAAQEVEHGCLGFEDGSAADGADFDGGHGHGDLEVSFQAEVEC
jgi:hypothetical protein